MHNYTNVPVPNSIARRQFVRTLSGVVGAAGVLPSSLAAILRVNASQHVGQLSAAGLPAKTDGTHDVSSVPPPRRLARIGLELYTLRAEMTRDPSGTLPLVRDMGYDDVELLWSMDNFGQTPQQVKALLDQLGLRAPSAHIAAEILRKDWDRSLEQAHLLGHTYLIVPSLPAEARDSLDAWRRWADTFNTAGAAARQANLWLAFHNEPDHVKPIDGVVPYDVFIERADPAVVRLQLDVGNMLMGGGDPFAYFAQYRDRYWSFHLKDVVPDRSADTELGAGIVDFPRFLAGIPDLDQKPCYVEQEGPADALASAQVDYNYLKTLEF